MKIKNCPFCGAKVERIKGFRGLNFFKCTNKKECGAIVSFDNDYFNANPDKAISQFNRRSEQPNIVMNCTQTGKNSVCIENVGMMNIKF